MENGAQRLSDAGFPAPENVLGDIKFFSEPSFDSGGSPSTPAIFEELEDLHFRDLMPIHAQSEDAISEIEVQAQEPEVSFDNQTRLFENLQQIMDHSNHGEIPDCGEREGGPPPPYESDDEHNQNFGEAYARCTLIEMGLLPNLSSHRDPFLPEIIGEVDRQSRDSQSGPGTSLLFFATITPASTSRPFGRGNGKIGALRKNILLL